MVRAAILLLLLTSCITERKCNRLFPPTVTVRVDTVHVPYQVEIPGETLRDTIPIWDTLYLKELADNATVREGDKTELRYWIDAYGNLVIECEAKEQILDLVRTYINTDKTVTRTESTPEWKFLVLGLVCLVVGFGLGIVKTR
jgi:hypothetical protein